MPKISILIAARNEAANIANCLRSVAALDYPKEQLEILIGNDASEDDTAQIVEEFVIQNSHFQLFNIEKKVANLKGKANVLAQLAQKSKGEYLLFTDADIEVPATWATEMSKHFEGNVGVVTGITTMRSGGIFGIMQGIEWLYYLSLIRFCSLFKLPLTALGNNMAVSRKAYDAVGGYETIGFSIIEDYALYHNIVKKGFDFIQLFDARILAISQPMPTFRDLMVQRKRWTNDAFSLPLQHQIGNLSNAFFLPFLIILAFFSIKWTVIIALLHYFFVATWLSGALNWIQARWLLWGIPIFWFYHIFMSFMMLLNLFFRKKTVWKGREY